MYFKYLECEGDADCVSNGSKGKCHRCKCIHHSGPGPEPEPFPSCLPENGKNLL